MITATQLTEHQDYIYNVAYRFTQDPIDAEDLKQDVILDLLENPDQYHGTAKITTFLYILSSNTDSTIRNAYTSTAEPTPPTSTIRKDSHPPPPATPNP